MAVSPEMLDVIHRLNEGVEIRAATRADAKGFTDFINAHYKRQKTEAYFHWQFFDAPHPAFLAVAYDGGALVGCFGVMVRALESEHPCGFLLDLLVADSHRSRALHIVLAERVREFTDHHGAVAVTSLSNPTGRKAISDMNGWKVAGVVRTLVRKPGQVGDEPSASDTAGHIAPRIEAFARPAGYCEWRFEKNSLYPYHQHRHSGGAYAATKSFTDPVTGKSYFDIVDYSAPDNAALDSLVREIVGGGRHEGGEFTAWALPTTPAYQVFKRHGFAESSQERFFCIGDVKEGFAHLTDIANWHLVEADSEVF